MIEPLTKSWGRGLRLDPECVEAAAVRSLVVGLLQRDRIVRRDAISSSREGLAIVRELLMGQPPMLKTQPPGPSSSRRPGSSRSPVCATRPRRSGAPSPGVPSAEQMHVVVDQPGSDCNPRGRSVQYSARTGAISGWCHRHDAIVAIATACAIVGARQP